MLWEFFGWKHFWTSIKISKPDDLRSHTSSISFCWIIWCLNILAVSAVVIWNLGFLFSKFFQYFLFKIVFSHIISLSKKKYYVNHMQNSSQQHQLLLWRSFVDFLCEVFSSKVHSQKYLHEFSTWSYYKYKLVCCWSIFEWWYRIHIPCSIFCCKWQGWW